MNTASISLFVIFDDHLSVLLSFIVVFVCVFFSKLIHIHCFSNSAKCYIRLFALNLSLHLPTTPSVLDILQVTEVKGMLIGSTCISLCFQEKTYKSKYSFEVAVQHVDPYEEQEKKKRENKLILERFKAAWQPPIKILIIDLSLVSYVDTVGIKTLTSVSR